MSNIEARESIRALIAQSGRLLDDNAFDAFVALFTADGRYRLEAASREIGSDMIWLQLDRNELAALLVESPQHVHDIATRTHVIAVDAVTVDGDGAEAQSTFSVFRTDKAGVSHVYAVGRYIDRMQRIDGAWRIADRRALTTTRMFRTPTPMPL